MACRLGLGAVPSADAETQMYNRRLERRIKRKVVGKRIVPLNTEIGKVVNCLACTCTRVVLQTYLAVKVDRNATLVILIWCTYSTVHYHSRVCI